MLEVKNRVSTIDKMIEVEDRHGNKEKFGSVADVCSALKCTRSYVYQALRKGVVIVGCKLRVVEP